MNNGKIVVLLAMLATCAVKVKPYCRGLQACEISFEGEMVAFSESSHLSILCLFF